MATDDGWKVRQDESGHEFGPFDWARIVELARNGRILPEYRLSHAEKTKGSWVKAGRVSLLVPIFEQLTKNSNLQSPSAQSTDVTMANTQQSPKPTTVQQSIGDAVANAAAPNSAANNPYDSSMEDIYTASANSELVQSRRGPSFSLGNFIDPSFDRFITPRIVSIIWIVVLILAGLVVLGLIVGLLILFYTIAVGRLEYGLATLYVGIQFLYICAICFWLLMIRVVLEGIVVIYNIYKTLLEIRDLQRG